MPHLKKLTVQPSNILPKMNMDLNQTFGCNNENLYSPAYISLIMEEEKSQSFLSEPESDVSDSAQNRPRKRQRLDHLSQEEKVMRRKLKNRVAAQTARDRKKAKMQELEEQVARLVTEKRVLFAKSLESIKRIQTLEQENSELKVRLGLVTLNNPQKVKEEVENESSSIVSEESRSLEQASLINRTQLKGQDLQILSRWMMQLVFLPAVARLMTLWLCCSSIMILNHMTSLTPILQMTKPENKSQSIQKWWGPHQRAWNPTKN